jgi:hypothetical protein
LLIEKHDFGAFFKEIQCCGAGNNLKIFSINRLNLYFRLLILAWVPVLAKEQLKYGFFCEWKCPETNITSYIMNRSQKKKGIRLAYFLYFLL